MTKKRPSDIRVIDTSVAAKWFLPDPLSAEADRVLEEMRLGRLRLAAPDLISYEMANILWQRQRKGEISARLAAAIMADFELLPIEKAPGDVISSLALRLACKAGCTAYDAAFVALAAELRTRLITADRRLTRLMASTPFAARLEWVGQWA